VNLDEDRIVADGLFYCVPWMKVAQDRIAQLESALREAMEWNWGEVERLDIPKEVYDQMHNALHGLTPLETKGGTTQDPPFVWHLFEYIE
jgi:hypothetical protein